MNIKTKVISISIAVLLLLSAAIVSLTVVNAADSEADQAPAAASVVE